MNLTKSLKPVVIFSITLGTSFLFGQQSIDSTSTLSEPKFIQRSAVYPITIENSDSKRRRNIGNKFHTTILKNGNYYLLSSDQVREILNSQSMNTDDKCVSIECLSSFGTNVGVEFTIGGEIKIVEDGFSFQFNLVNSNQMSAQLARF